MRFCCNPECIRTYKKEDGFRIGERHFCSLLCAEVWQEQEDRLNESVNNFRVIERAARRVN